MKKAIMVSLMTAGMILMVILFIIRISSEKNENVGLTDHPIGRAAASGEFVDPAEIEPFDPNALTIMEIWNENKKVGALTINKDGKLEFHGDAEISAMRFFRYLSKYTEEAFEILRERELRAELRLK